jgi:hypothetical protein
MDILLHLSFPGICAKLLNSMLRSFNERPGTFRIMLSKLLERKPFGFKSTWLVCKIYFYFCYLHFLMHLLSYKMVICVQNGGESEMVYIWDQ